MPVIPAKVTTSPTLYWSSIRIKVVENIFDDSLRSQADGDAGDSRAGQKRPQVEVENILHDLQKGQKSNDHDAGGADDGARVRTCAPRGPRGCPDVRRP